MKLRNQITLFLILLCAFGFAQIEHPKASPFSKIEQGIGLSKITLEYSRPAVRGRDIFGDLVPYGRIWRVGANESTKISIDSDVEVLGNKLPKGTYALYAFPEKAEWEIAFHKNVTHWGDGRKNYNPTEDAFRIKVKPQLTEDFQENFLIAFDSITHDDAQMNWHWANTKVSIPIKFDGHGKMKERIAAKLAENPTAQTYYEAARYLQEQGVDHQVALEYLNKALELGGDTYYFHRVKSLVEAAVGDYAAAIKSAEKSLRISKELEKDEFVRMNEKNIDLWKEKL